MAEKLKNQKPKSDGSDKSDDSLETDQQELKKIQFEKVQEFKSTPVSITNSFASSVPRPSKLVKKANSGVNASLKPIIEEKKNKKALAVKKSLSSMSNSGAKLDVLEEAIEEEDKDSDDEDLIDELEEGDTGALLDEAQQLHSQFTQVDLLPIVQGYALYKKCRGLITLTRKRFFQLIPN